MGRPIKQGIDYFPVDCQFDPKTEMYLLETESDGLAVLISLWQIIYSDEGYFVSYNEDLKLLIKKRVNIDIEKIKSCIDIAVNRDIFNKKLFNKYKILTSRAVQNRYFEISRRKKEIQYDDRFIINGVNVDINAVNVNINGVNVDINANDEEKEVYMKFDFMGIDGEPISVIKLKEKEWDNLINKTTKKFAQLCVMKLDSWYKGKNKRQYGNDNMKIYSWVTKAVQEDLDRKNGKKVQL